MSIMPAHKSRSLDVKFGITKKADSCINACIWFFIVQILIVYVFASLNKVHLDWLMARPISIWFKYKSDYWLIGPLLAKEWFQYAISWGGVLYDGAIFFLLLYKPTRKFGFILSIIFNLFNSAVFQIGIFPYMMIALTVFFFPPESVGKIFFKKKATVQFQESGLSRQLMWVIGVYFIVQLVLPIRHHLYPGDVHWSNEGHKMAWQMMLRAKSGSVVIEVEDKKRGTRRRINIGDYLTSNQRRKMTGEPDMIWQFVQVLKKEYADRGDEVAIYATSKISLNGHSYQDLIDPNVDLSSVPWERWNHSKWILTYDSYD